KTLLFFIFFVLTVFIPGIVSAQITAPGKSGSDKTNYPVFNETDSIYVFCAQTEGETIATLRGNTGWSGTKTFLWEKYNPGSAAFEFYFSESTASQISEINDLTDGCYRLTITQAENTAIERAWVFNNWFTASADIIESNCDWFKLEGVYTTAELKYYDLANNTELDVNKNIKVQWKTGDNVIAIVMNPQVFDPPAKNTDYTLVVYDKFACQGVSAVTYNSIVTKADFSIDKENGEAPLTVTFTNNSENGTPGQYEWFFFRDLDDIKRESEGSSTPVDSIEIVAYDDNPVYTYEYSGTYMVKLVSKKITGQQVCVDTVYLKDYIVADTSFIAVPNVFTPNGDGTNDEFVVKFWSMQSIEIDIFNRWGKRVHHWESGNVRGFEGTWTETVWDGRGMGGRYASPGVYYYVVKGEGRDGEERRTKGFVHLFRDND
ncbi:MAG TPA: gliding motility-associated C-terminal domain-containing protein, partial [Draconibacterium sp.]|nr:gliding motility-associated C-terminal domain-containing protein [Draconibacterium sp.]